MIDAKLDEIKNTFDSKYWQGPFYKSEQVKEPDDRANGDGGSLGISAELRLLDLLRLIKRTLPILAVEGVLNLVQLGIDHRKIYLVPRHPSH